MDYGIPAGTIELMIHNILIGRECGILAGALEFMVHCNILLLGREYGILTGVFLLGRDYIVDSANSDDTGGMILENLKELLLL